MKKTAFIITAAFIAVITCSSNQALANNKSKQIMVGDKILMFDIPQGSCFIDQTSSLQKSLHASLSGQVESSGKRKFLVAWVDCGKLARFGEDQDVSKITSKIGYINWLNPEIGPTYEGTREQFINTLSRKLTNAGREDFKVSKNSINTMLRQTMKTSVSTTDEMSVMGYTVIKQIPLEIRIKDATANFSTKEEGYNQLNAFINYQIKINE